MKSTLVSGHSFTVRLLAAPVSHTDADHQWRPEVQKTQSGDSPQKPVEQSSHHQSVGKLQSTQSQSETVESLYKEYLPSNELDRKAEPISNIHLDMMDGIIGSGLSIKLRLYINEYGKVVHIEELMVLNQDREFKDKLVDLLYDLTFLPAKKNGVTVSSYQDVSLSFNPILNQPLESTTE